MSRLFEEMRQIGIVVRDIDAAMRHRAEVCGVGPWFCIDRLPLTEFRYRGQRHDDILISIALANSGDVQLELIQQRCDTPSLYRDFLARELEGMQHWSSWPQDYDARLDAALAAGHEIGHQGDSARGRFVYLLAEGHPGAIIEMAELTPERARLFAAIRAAARDGDGTDPVRETWPA